MKTVKIKVCIMVMALLALNGLYLHAQNYAVDYDYDTWTHFEGIDAEGFDGLTLEAWINFEKYFDFGGSLYSGSFVISKEASVSNHYGFVLVVLSLYNADTGRLAMGLNFVDNGVNKHYGLHSYKKVPLNQWVHVASTWNGDSMSVFINGVFDRSLDVSQYSHFYDPPIDSLNIGSRRVGPYYTGTFGLIDEVRIWNVAHSEQEIRETMYKELNGNEPGLFAYWKLNEGSGQLVYDSGPNGFDGWQGQSSSVDSYDPIWSSSTAPLPYYSVQDGNWSNNNTWASGQLTPSTNWSSVEINDQVAVDTSVTVDNVDINPSGDLTIETADTLNINGDFTIKSDNTGTGSFIDSGTLNNSREVTVEQYLTQNNWHFIGIPVEEDSVGVFYIPGGSDIYLRTHLEASNSWGSWITNINTPLKQGRGYEVWVDDNVDQDETIEFKGTLNTGDYATGTAGFYDLEYTPDHGLNLISNPYPSAITADINNWNKNDVANSVWVWSGDAGNYLYWNGLNGDNEVGWGTLTNGIIPAMQGFFVEATGSVPELTIPQASRVHDGQSFYKSSFPPNAVKFSVNDEIHQDAVFIGFNQNASDFFDPEYDVRKLFGLDEAPQLYTISGPDTLSINVLSNYINSTFVDLAFSSEKTGWYNLKLDEMGIFSNGVKLRIEDLVTGEHFVPVIGEPFPFYHESGYDSPRFRLNFASTAGTDKPDSGNLKIAAVGDKINIGFPATMDSEIVLYSTDGRVVKHEMMENKINVTLHVGELKGIYILKVTTERGSVIHKILIS